MFTLDSCGFQQVTFLWSESQISLYRLASAFESCFMCKPVLGFSCLPALAQGWPRGTSILDGHPQTAACSPGLGRKADTGFVPLGVGWAQFPGSTRTQKDSAAYHAWNAKKMFYIRLQGTQQCQVQQQEKPHTGFEFLAPEFPCIPLFPFPLYYKRVFISFSGTVIMPSVGSKVG